LVTNNGFVLRGGCSDTLLRRNELDACFRILVKGKIKPFVDTIRHVVAMIPVRYRRTDNLNIMYNSGQ